MKKRNKAQVKKIVTEIRDRIRKLNEMNLIIEIDSVTLTVYDTTKLGKETTFQVYKFE